MDVLDSQTYPLAAWRGGAQGDPPGCGQTYFLPISCLSLGFVVTTVGHEGPMSLVWRPSLIGLSLLGGTFSMPFKRSQG